MTALPGGTTKCDQEGCTATHKTNHWATKRADRDGWFHQRNGTAWCPDHNPPWVASWRAKNEAQTPTTKEN